MLFEFKNKQTPPFDYLTVKSAKDLLSSNKCKQSIKQIRKHVALPEQEFKHYYLCAIENFAEFVQLAPASEFYHHAYPGGLIEHTLEVIELAQKYRKGILLPTGVTAEHEPEVRDIYTYGIFCGAICHDLAKPAVDQRINYIKDMKRPARSWNPYSGSLIDIDAKYFKIEFINHRDYKTHERSSMLFVHHVLPTHGLAWLQSNQDVFIQFVNLLSGQQELGDIATIIKRADQRSTSKALGAQQTPTFSFEKPLFLKIKSALRFLIADGKISLNRKGANGWIAHNHVWILAKIAVDKVREQLEVEGHIGVPSDNSRMFDIMMDHALIQNNPEGNKAIWKITVETLDWKPTNEFSVLKIPLNIAYASNDYNAFDGMLNVMGCNHENDSSTIEKSELDPNAEQEASTYNVEQTDVVEAPMECEPPLVEPKKADPLIDGSDPAIIRQHPGTDFFFWVKESLTNPSISKNTATSLIHNTKAGLLLVSPLIFKEYCEQHSLKNWSAVQKSFQALRLNLKTPGKGENTFKVRVSGKRKISTLQCWIIPHSELDGCSLPNINSHLDVLNIEI